MHYILTTQKKLKAFQLRNLKNGDLNPYKFVIQQRARAMLMINALRNKKDREAVLRDSLNHFSD